MNHRDDIAARALDALEPHERERFDEQADAATLAEVARMQETAAALGGAVAVAPPPALRASILAQIADVEQESPATLTAVEPEPSPGVREAEGEPVPVLMPTSARAAGPRELAARRRWFQRPASLVGAAAAAVVLLVGGVAIGQTMRAPDPVSALVHASDVQSSSAALEDGTQATLLWSHDQADVALVFSNLAALDDSQVYEAWFMRDGVPIAAGIFDGGESSVVHMLDGDLHEGDGIAVTIEPDGGSDAPTSEPLMVMST